MMSEKLKISGSVIHHFKNIVGQDYVIEDSQSCMVYGKDKTEDLFFPPDVVICPSTPEEISAILQLCNQEKIPVTPRGAGTGLSGGSLPVHGGVVISMERFNKIVDIDELNLQATVEPGVITEVFQQAVREKGLFYPPDPASRGSCYLGGNVATNAGGPKAVKYGVTRNYVINLQVVTPTGDIIWTAANVLKNSTGYNLTQLICGSEGTLGIITKIVVRLLGYPQRDILMMIPFSTNAEACRAIAAIFTAGIIPSGMEFFERQAAEYTLTYCREVLHSPVSISLTEGMNAYLICELDGNDEDTLLREAERVTHIIAAFQSGEVLFADSATQKEELWKIRKNISPAVNWYTLTKSDDVVVPRSQLPALIRGIKDIGKKYAFNTICFGHLGDGNLHVNILKEQIEDHRWKTEIPERIGEIFSLVVRLGGTLSGEHGIGITKKPYMDMALSQVNQLLMRSIKKAFDPNGILNPSKII